MIYLLQNDRQYDYDVRAIALAFFERDKIKEIEEEELASHLPLHTDEDPTRDEKLLRLDFTGDEIFGSVEDGQGRQAKEAVACDYNDHEHCRNDVCRFLYRLFSSFTGKILPWGMLTGIRPTKIFMKWMEEETDPLKLEARFSET